MTDTDVSKMAQSQTTVPPPPPVPETVSYKQDPSRRSSFGGFLRKQKSSEGRSMLSKKNKGFQYPPPQSVPRVPPQLPQPANFPAMDSFIGEDHRVQYGTAIEYPPNGPVYAGEDASISSSSPPSYGVPMPPLPISGNEFDPYARTESMTHRGRYSYASSAFSVSGVNSPRRVRRRKDPTPFNILVVGAQNSGKTSFIQFLRTSLISSKDRRREKTPSPPQTADYPVDSPFTAHYLETEVDHERIGVTIWDSQGFEKKFVDLQLREMSSFLESKFEETFTEEQKVVRAPGVRDTHIHCVFLILDPSRLDTNLAQSKKNAQLARFDGSHRLLGVLDEDLDVQVLKTLQGKTTVIPVISKADTITTNHMAMLKRAVWDSLKQAKLDPLEALTLDDSESLDERDEDALADGDDSSHRSDSIDLDEMLDELDRPTDLKTANRPANGSRSHRRTPSGLGSRLTNAENSASGGETPYLPMSILSPDTYEPGIVGRRFPWGFADPYNSEHCDFVRLKDSVFSEWRAELREASREIWYEGWRTSRLNRRTANGIAPASSKFAGHGRKNVSANLPPKQNYAGANPYSGGPVGQTTVVSNGYNGASSTTSSPISPISSLSSSSPLNRDRFIKRVGEV